MDCKHYEKAVTVSHRMAIGVLLMLSVQLFSQDAYLSDLTISPLKIIENCKPAEKYWLYDTENDEPTPFLSAFRQNVFDYFKLNEKYDSPLKKEVYKQTPEYKILLDSLEIIYQKFLSTTYYEYGFNPVSVNGIITITDENYDYSKSGGNYIGNYNVYKKGFEIELGDVIPSLCRNSGFTAPTFPRNAAPSF